jgi:hypothetical protein
MLFVMPRGIAYYFRTPPNSNNLNSEAKKPLMTR